MIIIIVKPVLQKGYTSSCIMHLGLIPGGGGRVLPKVLLATSYYDSKQVHFNADNQTAKIAN